ncbi:hypothetical protein HK096_000615, partial [Nowakowskiella sp. JEL0078]
MPIISYQIAKLNTMSHELQNEDEFVNELQNFSAFVLVIGHGSRGQYKNVEKAKQDLDKMIQIFKFQFDIEDKIAVLFGGDPFRRHVHDIAHLIKHLHSKNLKVFAVHPNEYNNQKTYIDEYVDHVLYVPSIYDSAGNMVWGGMDDNCRPRGPTAVYLGDRLIELGKPFCLLVLGGGPTALEEIKYAYSKSLNILYTVCEAKNQENGVYGAVHDWAQANLSHFEQ